MQATRKGFPDHLPFAELLSRFELVVPKSATNKKGADGVRALLSRRKSEEKPEYTHLCACDDDAEQQQQQQQQQQHGGASRRDWLESRH